MGKIQIQLYKVAIFLLLFGACSQQKKNIEVASAYGVISRTIPGMEKNVILEKIESTREKDIFELETNNDKIIIRGTSGVAMASGFNYYLKNFCNVHISWCGRQLNMPEKLPQIETKIRQETPYQYRYYLNYCTTGYTTAFWDWKRWEQEIDWMALQGINMPLAITGHEAVLMNVYQQLGMSKEDIKGFISGPSYLPWFIMGNLDGFGGPLPDVWIEEQQILQKKILERERSLGMKPVLPAFSGHVPEQIIKHYPYAHITKMKSWSGFPGTYILAADDELFQRIGNLYIHETNKLFGTNHFYSADTFNEMNPPNDELSYLTSISKAVYSSMATSDPEAVWVMQGWLFLDSEYWKQEKINALLDGVPNDKMIILDLFSTAKPVWNRTEAYGGRPWIWNMLHNWGGKQGMYGRAQNILNALPSLTKNPSSGKLCGIGLTPEGIEVNPVIFDLFGTMVWTSESVDLSKWTSEYVKRRYGSDNSDLQKAWEILIKTVYSCQTSRHGPQGSYLAMRPNPEFKEGPFARAEIFYDVNRVKDALHYFLNAAAIFADSETFRYDLVDLTRQAMSDKAQQMLRELKFAYKTNNIETFKTQSDMYLEAIKDLDLLLSSDSMFLVSTWLNKARNRAHNEKELKLYEFNSRNIITQWGPKDSPLKDYAQRQYGGMMGDFNYKRWKIFFMDAIEALESNRKLNWAITDDKISDWEDKWANSTNEYLISVEVDYIDQVEKIYGKYLKE
ncbi:alpha-N-acetylglucosaminidase [Sunxiuqinia sp. A32]|uniref:alpha-N-acetylglucosaminidase n=1 Tax=Sunxiuqinia sp. A32 TaxID=3461496 RepID=UPI0040460484